MTNRWMCTLVWSSLSIGCVTVPARAQDEPWLREDVEAARQSIRAEDLKATVYYLASDALQGRDTPSPGLAMAADYLEARFRAAGLEVLRQSIEMEGVTQPTELQGSLTLGGEELTLSSPMQVAVLAGGRTRPIDLEPSELMYIGAPADLFGAAEREPRSKVLVVVAGAATDRPPDPRRPSLGPRDLSFFGARLAARAVLYVTQPGPEGDAEYDALLAAAGTPSLAGMRGAQAPVVALRGTWFLPLLAASLGVAPEDLFTAPIEVPDAIGEFAASIPAQQTATLTAENIGALLPGRDPELSNETVIVSAHYDHIGTRPGGDDEICNGADDDASGTTALVELASALSLLDQPPRRSILLLAFCGEEKGLLGSKHYAEDPLRPLETTVADINVEMIGRPDDIGPRRAWVTGYSLSELGPMLSEAAETMDFEVYEHETLSDRLFGASDNASLARVGIPAHSISAGSLHSDYHQPSDEADRLDYANMTEVVRAIFLGTLWVAERDEAPTWNAEEPRAQPYAERRQR